MAQLAFTLICSVAGLWFAIYLAKWVLQNDDGTKEMQSISNAIREGAEAFLARQYKTIAMLTIPVAVVIYLLYTLRQSSGQENITTSQLALYVSGSFIFGAICSAIAGYIGMWVAIRANIRTAAASRTSLNLGLQIALRGGAVSGLFVVVMSLLGVGGLFTLLRLFGISAQQIPFLIVGYGFGASFVALFAQLGGGIYTKAADVGADLVGKVEAGIPEDDPRNPAVIADLVGDNVGDCAGRGADLFESTAAENIGAMILGVALYPYFGLKGVLFPLVVRAFGVLASMAGIWVVHTEEDGDPMQALNRGYYLTTLLAFIGFGIGCLWLLRSDQAPYAWLHFWACGLIGPATNIIAGMAVGMESTALPVIVIAIAIIASYALGESSGVIVKKTIEGKEFVLRGGLFGTAVATMGMLGTAAYILAMDTFGPIADNAGGIIEMSQQPEEIRHKTDRLDAVGNTTKALTKGYAIGSAALAAFLLFAAYLDEVRAYGTYLVAVDISKPQVFVGGLLGSMLVFLFAAMAIRAVGTAAGYVIDEVRRQFREHPGILQGTEQPSYRQCVDIVTAGALKQMVLPGLLIISMPIVVGLVFKQLGIGAETVAAFLMVGTIAGILMATVLNNSGGAWDNSKKYIETGALGGKGSETHKAAVVGDTVGDPFKDTAGPSLHVVIKLLSTITLVLAPLFL